ncbi:MAG: hypothetical protein U9Q19_09095, partial [Pseudomonadota bacterium]|nr:hypothetical protein [Pseudomonadota bacterium]
MVDFATKGNALERKIVGKRDDGGVIIASGPRDHGAALCGSPRPASQAADLGKFAKETKESIIELLKPFSKYVKTITFDNGKEFAKHIDIAS